MDKTNLSRFLQISAIGLGVMAAVPAHADLSTALGGGAGGATGALIGQQMGGKGTSVLGAAAGGAVGAAATTSGPGQMGAVIGGAMGGAAGAAVGQTLGGVPGAIIGGGAGGALGAQVGKSMTENSQPSAPQSALPASDSHYVKFETAAPVISPGNAKKAEGPDHKKHGHPPGRALGREKNHR